MIEENLLNYGVLGLWTASLIAERYYFQKNLGKDMRELTKAINNKFIKTN